MPLPPWSKHSPAWPVVRPHGHSPSQPGPKDLCPCVPSSCDPTAPGASCARRCTRHERSIPGHCLARCPLGQPIPGTEQPRCQPWEHHPWHSQSRGSLPASFPEPSSRNGPSSPAATCAAGGSSRDQGHPIPRQRQLHSLGSGRKLSCKLEKHQLISGGNNSLSTGDKDSDLYTWCFVFFQPE